VSMAPRIDDRLATSTVCWRYDRPSDFRTPRCVSRVPAKLRLSVTKSVLTGCSMQLCARCPQANDQGGGRVAGGDHLRRAGVS